MKKFLRGRKIADGRRISDYITALLLWILAGHALYVEVIEKSWRHESVSTDHKVAILLGMVAVVAITIGLERFVHFDQFHKELENLLGVLEQKLTVRLLTGKDVTAESIRFIGDAEFTIRAIVYEKQAIDTDTLSDSIAKHLELHVPIRFDLIIVCDLDTATPEFWDIHKARFESYTARKVSDRFFRYILDSTKPFGLNMLMVDGKHLGISFSPTLLDRKQDKEVAMAFASECQATRYFENWFDSLKRETVPYDDAEKARVTKIAS